MVEAGEWGVGRVLSDTDRLNILELLTKADSAATRRDPKSYVSYFTEDAILDGEMGSFTGKQALLRSVMAIWQSEGQASAHLTLNAVVTQSEGNPDEAEVTSTLVILSIGSSISFHSVNTIVQHVVRKGTSWLIRRRSVMGAGASAASSRSHGN